MHLTVRRTALPSTSSCAAPPPRLCYAASPAAVYALRPEADELDRDLALAEIVDDARSVGAELLVHRNGRPLALVAPDGTILLPEDPAVAAIHYAAEAAEEQRQREEGLTTLAAAAEDWREAIRDAKEALMIP